jgi:hypothetical protein
MYMGQMFLHLMEAIEKKMNKTGKVEVGDVLEFETETSPRSPSKGKNIVVTHTVTLADLSNFEEYA